MDSGIITFPKGFLWGASTASYQTEGDNRASALWEWEARKGWERSGPAAGSWERFEQDMNCLKALRLNAYRFSLEWSRVHLGRGVFDSAALARYRGWARRLREEGIRPFVCLHHFSEPAWALKAHPRGWLDEGFRAAFLEYVERAASALCGEVGDWIVFNEPMVFLVGAYGFGHFPPGRWMLANVGKEFNPALVPSLARTHDLAYELIHRLQPQARVGVAHHVSALEPARHGDEEAVEAWDWFMHKHFLNLTRDRLDFIGVNYYTRIYVHRSWVPFLPMGVVPGYAEFEKGVTPAVFRLLGGRRGDRPRTQMGWEVVPEGLGKVVGRLWEGYRKPIYITENGIADGSGRQREGFIRDHLASLAGAMKSGADVRGYFHWSLMDNYEWGSYAPRFGLFDRERRPMPGASFYADVAGTGELRGKDSEALGRPAL